MIAPIRPLYNGQISKSDLRDIAKQFLEFIDKEKIYSLEDLNQKDGERFDLDTITGDFIEIELRPSKSKTPASTISYIIPKIGIPLEVRMNASENYSVVIVKNSAMFEGYLKLASDKYGNIIQDKFIETIEFALVRKELEALIK